MRALLIGPSVPSGAAGKRWIDAEVRRARRSADVVIAVDGGLDHCARLRILPDLAVGDWDSLRDSRLLDRVPVVSHPVEKDRSDLYHALEELLRRGRPESVLCLGFGGGRPDHHLAVLHELSLFSEKGMARGEGSLILRDADAEYLFLSKALPRAELRIRKGSVVSIFAMSGKVRGLTIDGFRYPLRDATIEPSSRGLSNETVSARARVTLRAGRLLVVLPK